MVPIAIGIIDGCLLKSGCNPTVVLPPYGREDDRWC